MLNKGLQLILIRELHFQACSDTHVLNNTVQPVPGAQWVHYLCIKRYDLLKIKSSTETPAQCHPAIQYPLGLSYQVKAERNNHLSLCCIMLGKSEQIVFAA